MTILEQNYKLIEELEPRVQWAAREWMEECDRIGLSFRILEAFRSQERQNKLYAQGRTVPGVIRTWARTSVHTKRLALDIAPVSCKTKEELVKRCELATGKKLLALLTEIGEIGLRWGIYRPAELLKLGDFGHFQFDGVRAYEPPHTTPTTALRRLERLLRQEYDLEKREAIKREMKRVAARKDDYLQG